MSAQYKTAGHYFDGLSAKSNDVSIQIDADGIAFTQAGQHYFWAMDDLRSIKDQANQVGLIVKSLNAGDARLHIRDASAVQFLNNLPNRLNQHDITVKTKRRVFVWGVGALASVLLILFVIIPLSANRLAQILPTEREAAFGRHVLSQITWVLENSTGKDNLVCDQHAGQDALDAMVTRLQSGFETQYDLQVLVYRIDATNAFAAPGGHVVIFDGLLQAAQSPEEVAAVLAHEFGHVVNRDPTRLSLRAAGSAGIISLLLGDFVGGFGAVAVAETMLQASYSRDAEIQADQFSHQLFATLGLPSARFGDFFARLHDEFGDDDPLMSHFASHPDLKSREESARAADRVGSTDFQPVLSALQWQALRDICITETE